MTLSSVSPNDNYAFATGQSPTPNGGFTKQTTAWTVFQGTDAEAVPIEIIGV